MGLNASWGWRTSAKSALPWVLVGACALGCGPDKEKVKAAMVEARVILASVEEWDKSNPDECPTVEALREEKLLSEKSDRDPWGSAFVVVCGEAKLSVGSLGPDRRPNTSDDIVVSSSEPRPKRSEAVATLGRWLKAATPAEQADLLYRRDITEGEFLVRTKSVKPSALRLVTDGCGPRALDGGCQVLIKRASVEPSVFWLRVTPDGYRVDWRGSYIVNPMTMAAFRAAMPTAPSVWRLNAKLDTYFNYEFMNQQATYYSFRLSEVGERVDAIHAYGKKGDPDAEAMFKALSSGAGENVTVSVAFPATRQSNGILKLVAFYGTSFMQSPRENEDRVSAISGSAPTSRKSP